MDLLKKILETAALLFQAFFAVFVSIPLFILFLASIVVVTLGFSTSISLWSEMGLGDFLNLDNYLRVLRRIWK